MTRLFVLDEVNLSTSTLAQKLLKLVRLLDTLLGDLVLNINSSSSEFRQDLLVRAILQFGLASFVVVRPQVFVDRRVDNHVSNVLRELFLGGNLGHNGK